MNERPIIFSSEMVKAILEDKKTQTRRVIKPQPVQDPDGTWRSEIHPRSGYNSEQTLRHYLDLYCPYGKKGDRLWVREMWAGDEFTGVAYKATDPDALPFGEEVTFKKWKRSIFMPHWASRIDLEIVNVRVDRLQEINGDECTLEGVEVAWSDPNNSMQEINAFKALWNSINAERGYGWDVNPWVWVIEFKKVGL